MKLTTNFYQFKNQVWEKEIKNKTLRSKSSHTNKNILREITTNQGTKSSRCQYIRTDTQQQIIQDPNLSAFLNVGIQIPSSQWQWNRNSFRLHMQKFYIWLTAAWFWVTGKKLRKSKTQYMIILIWSLQNYVILLHNPCQNRIHTVWNIIICLSNNNNHIVSFLSLFLHTNKCMAKIYEKYK